MNNEGKIKSVAELRADVEAAVRDARADCPGYPEHVSSGHALRLADAVETYMDLAGLFQTGVFTLRSGKKSNYKVECDALTPADWAGVAAAVVEENLLPPFGSTWGVPRGGIPLALAMDKYKTPGCPTALVCEDVVTTGGSIERFVSSCKADPASTFPVDDYVGLCFLARGKCPEWIVPFLQMSSGEARCPVVIKNFQCGLKRGHTGKHMWANGD